MPTGLAVFVGLILVTFLKKAIYLKGFIAKQCFSGIRS